MFLNWRKIKLISEFGIIAWNDYFFRGFGSCCRGTAGGNPVGMSLSWAGLLKHVLKHHTEV